MKTASIESGENLEHLAAYLAVAVRAEVKAEAVARLLIAKDGSEIAPDAFQSLCRGIAAQYADTTENASLAAAYRQLAADPKS